MERILAIGDIHGELSLFEKLLEKASYTPEKDQLVLIGDYIDRGPDSCGVLEKVMELKEQGAIVLRGNHEEMLLGSFDENEGSLEHWMRNGASETIESYATDDDMKSTTEGIPDSKILKKHVQFIRELDYFFENHDYIFVHAGLDPEKSLSEMDRHTFVWIRDPFFSGYHGDKTVIFGHTPTTYLHGDTSCHAVYFGDNRIIGIDGGAVFGGQLNCLELPSKRVYSVQA